MQSSSISEKDEFDEQSETSEQMIGEVTNKRREFIKFHSVEENFDDGSQKAHFEISTPADVPSVLSSQHNDA